MRPNVAANCRLLPVIPGLFGVASFAVDLYPVIPDPFGNLIRPFGRARGEPLGGGAPRSAQPPEPAYSGGGAIKPLFTQHQPCPICNLSRTLSNLHGHPFTYFCLVRKYLIIIHLLYQMVVKSTPSDRSSN